MITWTETAKTELERHVAAVRTRMISVGADADEVAADLERHVESELIEAKIRVATPDDVRRVLQRMGAVEAGLLESRDVDSKRGDEPKPWFNGFVTGCCFVFGVVLPLVTLVFEVSTRLCSSELFDPIPTIGHVLMILIVPLANWLALRNARLRYNQRALAPAPRWLGMLNGAAVVVAAIYALLLAMITPFAVIGIILYGLGLLPLAPLLSLITALICRARLRRQEGNARVALPGWKQGAGLALLLMLGLESQSILTELGMRLTRSENPASVQRGLAFLRSVGSEERLLQHCYPRNNAAMDLVSFVFRLGQDTTEVSRWNAQAQPGDARTLYYRVTGRPFNQAPVPTAGFEFGGRRRMSDDWVWDADTGGEVVGQRIKNLALAESRIDGTLNADALTSYVEWTMVFKNTARSAQEARAQIMLPPGGVVSRLTLWVNGEEREAAFAGRAQVREAYKQVVVVQRRDPVLVTTKGPDRVLVQCFPVPAGGEMKIRIGVTAPLAVPSADMGVGALLRLPMIIEQNFGVVPELVHNVWLESPSRFALESTDIRVEQEKSGQWAAHGALRLRPGETLPLVAMMRSPERRDAWAVHPQMPGKVFFQSLRETQPIRRRGIVVVVDGSKMIGPMAAEIADVLAAQEGSTSITLILASDAVMICPDREPVAVARWLRQQRFEGGQDNLEALTVAWDVATDGEDVLWVHGPQPCGWQSSEALLQRETRRPGRVGVREFSVIHGGNVVLEKLEGFPRVSAAPRLGSVREDLQVELRRLLTGESWVLVRSIESAVSSSLAAVDHQEKGAHIARLWAAEEVQRLLEQSPAKRAAAVELAAKFQLVTSVSGAVVLETKQQFDAAGLAAIDPSTAPTIPEPTTVALIMGGAAAVFVIWRRRDRIVRHKRSAQAK
jgi:hypothetical protein